MHRTNEYLNTCHRTNDHIDACLAMRVFTFFTALHLTRANPHVWTNALRTCIPMPCVQLKCIPLTHLHHGKVLIDFKVHEKIFSYLSAICHGPHNRPPLASWNFWGSRSPTCLNSHVGLA